MYLCYNEEFIISALIITRFVCITSLQAPTYHQSNHTPIEESKVIMDL